MLPVNQSIVGQEVGDSLRACVASLFELKLDQVPHFKLYTDEVQRQRVYELFIAAMGYAHMLSVTDPTPTIHVDDTVNGYTWAETADIDDCEPGHAVIIDTTGTVVHDPLYTKRWLGVNLLETKQFKSYKLFRRTR